MGVIEKDLQARLKHTSKKLGLTEREVIHRAVASYVGHADDISALYHELRAWDVMSAKTMGVHGF